MNFFPHFKIISVMPQILETWKLCHSMLCGWRMSYSQKIMSFWASLGKVHDPLNWRGRMRLFWEILFFSWSKQHVHWVFFLFFLFWSSCAQPSPCPKGKQNLYPNWALYVKDIVSYIWATHGTASQNKQFTHLKRKSIHAWSMRFFYVTWPTR